MKTKNYLKLVKFLLVFMSVFNINSSQANDFITGYFIGSTLSSISNSSENKELNYILPSKTELKQFLEKEREEQKQLNLFPQYRPFLLEIKERLMSLKEENKNYIIYQTGLLDVKSNNWFEIAKNDKQMQHFLNYLKEKGYFVFPFQGKNNVIVISLEENIVF